MFNVKEKTTRGMNMMFKNAQIVKMVPVLKISANGKLFGNIIFLQNQSFVDVYSDSFFPLRRRLCKESNESLNLKTIMIVNSIPAMVRRPLMNSSSTGIFVTRPAIWKMPSDLKRPKIIPIIMRM